MLKTKYYTALVHQESQSWSIFHWNNCYAVSGPFAICTVCHKNCNLRYWGGCSSFQVKERVQKGRHKVLLICKTKHKRSPLSWWCLYSLQCILNYQWDRTAHLWSREFNCFIRDLFDLYKEWAVAPSLIFAQLQTFTCGSCPREPLFSHVFFSPISSSSGAVRDVNTLLKGTLTVVIEEEERTSHSFVIYKLVWLNESTFPLHFQFVLGDHLHLVLLNLKKYL